MSKQYFISYSHVGDAGNSFGFGSCYVWMDSLTVESIQGLREEIAKLSPDHKNAVPISIVELDTEDKTS